MTCNRKYFRSKREAKQRKNAYEDKFGKKITIYKCSFCDGYHYTTKSTIEDKEHYRTLKKHYKSS